MGWAETTTSVFAACAAPPVSIFEPDGGIGPPTVFDLVPSIAAAGTVVAVTIRGTNFTAGATVQVSGVGVVVTNVVVVSSTVITCTFTVDPGAAATVRDVTVTTL